MDKLWMSSSRLSTAYDEGLNAFLEFAQRNNPNLDVIPCPCVNCINLCHHSIDNVRYHLFAHGFDENYKIWSFHGEKQPKSDSRCPNNSIPPDAIYTKDMLHDAFKYIDEEPDSLKSLLEECDKPLYVGSKYNALSGLLKFQNLKGQFGCSDASFDALFGKPLSKATIDVVDAQLLDQAHLYVLRNIAVMEPYIEQHMLELKDLNPRHARKSTWLQSQHSRTFISWFKKELEKRLANGEDICDDVRWLAKGPNFVVSKYSGFAINEYHFHTTSRDESRTTQCSGVSLVAHTMQIASAKDSNPVLCFCDMESDSASDHNEDSKQRGPIYKAKANKVKLVITYNKKGVPVEKEATKLSTFEGLVARTMVPITYAYWLEVSEEVREGLWQYVLEKFAVDPKIRKQTLQSIGKKWRNFKHYLYAKFIKNQSKDPKANLFKPPKDYPFIKKEDWKVFVSHRVTKKWEEKSTKAKNTRAHHKYNHRLSRKGYVGLINDIMQETGKTKEEIDRTLLWKKARELKTGGYESDVKMIVDKIDELHKSRSFGEVTCGTHDVLTEALGTQEQRGRVRGMGKFITPQQYFYLPKNVKYYLEIENERMDKRINKLEDDLEKLKRGVLNVSKAASCQVGGVIEDVEKEPRDESLDNSCLLAVEFAANVVAKGTIMKYRESLIPIPLEEEFIVKVKDALGHILSWPRHLVIRCSDLGKVVGKPVKKHATPVKKHVTPVKKHATPVKEGATPLKEEIGSNKKEKGTGKNG
ncbi:unnamed protein product [Lactuca virosa]|uniref:Transposase-associated domain-containing protein n=1 Tax=Lactuca virosa TaxID=75947 RepID=A0AAU9PJJ6_9ASTR|nr:unnamed protein product [Lactuca virosa]